MPVYKRGEREKISSQYSIGQKYAFVEVSVHNTNGLVTLHHGTDSASLLGKYS